MGKASGVITALESLLKVPPSELSDFGLVAATAAKLSINYERLGELARARSAASVAAINLPTKEFLGHYWSYLKTPEDYATAVSIFRQAADLFPGSPYAFAYLGAGMMNALQKEGAVQQLSVGN